uniref:Uncharacterized protein n=1 Tax=Chrysotila carterae TaxID=13221 RepID=A0A7S4BPP0_CHRCT
MRVVLTAPCAGQHLRPRRRNSAGRIIQRIANAVTNTSRNSTTTDLKNDDTTNANDNNFTSSGNVNTNSVPSGGLETPRSENDQVWPDASSKSKRRLSLLFRRGQKRASALEQRVVAETPEFALQRERFASWRRTGRSASSVHGRHADDGGSAEDHELTAAQRTHSRFYFGV